jgi:hypothetical protein
VSVSHSKVSDGQRFLDTVSRFSTVLAVKLYRLELDTDVSIPVLPCLDHEAMLHEGIAPHAAAYVQDADGDLHEVVYIPAARRLDIEVASTMGECSSASRKRFIENLKAAFPYHSVRVIRPSHVRGGYRVVAACRAQVSLRDVLLGSDLDKARNAVDRLQTISSIMEKESRVASWGARTVMTPLVAVAGFLSYEILGAFSAQIGSAVSSLLRYTVVGLVGGFFLYYGLKAVQLTEMANRIWKRSAEYGLILNERRRLAKPRS